MDFRSAVIFIPSLTLAIYYVARRLRAHFFAARTAKARGCAAPASLPSRDPFFCLDNFRDGLRASKENRRMRQIYEQLHRFGFTFQSRPFGKRVISTVEPRNIQFVFATEHEKFGVGPIREVAQAPLTGRGIITSDGHIWSDARPLIRPTFTRTQIADRESFDVHVSRFLDLLPKDGSTVDLRPLFERLILDSSSEFIFGDSFNSLLPDCPIDSKKFIESFNYAQAGVGKRVVFGKMRFLIRDKRFWDSCEVVQSYTRRHVERALLRRKQEEKDDISENEHRKYILVHELAKESDDKTLLESQLLNVFFAGRDTPGTALTNTFHTLARYPRVWTKIREEVQGLKPEDLSFEKLKSLRYVQHTINEALRLYPPVANNSRSCLEPTILPTGGGPDHTSPICVMPGDSISINFFTLHRRAEYFGPDPEAFRPERWKDLRTTWEFLPFGGGGRHCPAQQLALFWVGYVLVRMALRYKELENRDEVEEFVEDMKLNMESKHGARVGLVLA